MASEDIPGILLIGSPNVGKRTILSRLLGLDLEDCLDVSSRMFFHRWNINTKYYSADVLIWVAQLGDGFFSTSLSEFNRLEAVVMVFDMTDLASLSAVKEWVSQSDIGKIEILMFVGNKVDLVSGHSAHVEYRRQQQRLLDSDNPFDDYTEFGISETETLGLLGDDDPTTENKMSCLEWCIELNIEYIEACASNPDFDKCLSTGGDTQGVDRIRAALSAHMWPGMILKSGITVREPSLPETQESSEDEEYEVEYRALSAGSEDDPGEEEMDTKWISEDGGIGEGSEMEKGGGIDGDVEKSEKKLGDIEGFMSEIASVRDSLRLMPDFQRREMAAMLAMKMATLFGDDDDDYY